MLKFINTELPGVFIIEARQFPDERGFLATTWSAEEFKAHGLNSLMVQAIVSYSIRQGTLRGMHFQRAPFAQAKLVRCTRGAIYDVAIDLRPNSPTFKKWAAVELTAQNHRMFYIPEGFAHGFQTLADETEVFYQLSKGYTPEAAGGVRWDDPAFGIEWPDDERTIVSRDRNYPDFKG